MKIGFYINRLMVTGQGVEPAELIFTDGLNVISGPSNTGKSFAHSCIDYALGSGTPPAQNEASLGYQTVVLSITSRVEARRFEIHRSLAGGGAKILTYGGDGVLMDTTVLAARHSAQNPNTISGFLLSLTGLWNRNVRETKEGERRSLSYRDVALLTIVDEVRIMATRPPQHSGQHIHRTVESDTFRFLITGQESPEVFVPTKKEKGVAKSQRDLVIGMIAEELAALNALGIPEEFIEPELEEIEAARGRAAAQYDAARLGVVNLESSKAEYTRQMRELQSRKIILRGLHQRFELLEEHYDSDLNRLTLVEENGKLLQSFPAHSCPVCGSAPEHHRPDECSPSFNLNLVRSAAHIERKKIEDLKVDLNAEISSIKNELNIVEGEIEQCRLNLESCEDRVKLELMPQVRMTTDAMNGKVLRRDLLLKAKVISDRLTELRKREGSLRPENLKVAKPDAVEPSAPSTAGLSEYVRFVESLLEEWKFPEADRVSFSETTQDIVIGTQARASHGKGVRALTCSAVIIGLMRHCLAKRLPHPSFVVLDSALVAYKDPDPGKRLEPDSLKIRQAGVKPAFYESLGRSDAPGQIITFENDNPPEELVSTMNYIHFSKSDVGRYGFFPFVPSGA